MQTFRYRRRRKGHVAFENLESRLLLAYEAMISGEAPSIQIEFSSDDAGDILALSVDDNMNLVHNRGDDPGFSSELDIDSTLSGVNSVNLLDIHSIRVAGNGGDDELQIDNQSLLEFISNFEFHGGSDHDTLRGPHHESRWSIDGLNQGTLNGALQFSGVENLDGGNAKDHFLFTTGAIQGLINGGDAEADPAEVSGDSITLDHRQTAVLKVADFKSRQYRVTSDHMIVEARVVANYASIENLKVFTPYNTSTRVSVDSTPASSVVHINTHDADDRIFIAHSGIDSRLIVNSYDGDDVVEISSTGTDSVVDVNGGVGSDQLELQNTGAGSRVQFDGDEDGDTLTVRATSATSEVQLNGGADRDTIHFGSTDDATSVISNILGTLMIDGGEHPAVPTMTESVTAKGETVTVSLPTGDIWNLQDPGYLNPATYNLSATTFDRDETVARTMYVGIETIHLSSGAGVNEVNVASTAPTSKATITTQDSADAINLATTSTGSILIVNTAGGNDDIDITTTGQASVTQINAGTGEDEMRLMTSGLASGVELNGQAGNDGTIDPITVNTTGTDSVVDVNGGVGSDQLELQNTGAGSRVQFDGDEDGDTLTVRATSQRAKCNSTEERTVTRSISVRPTTRRA